MSKGPKLCKEEVEGIQMMFSLKAGYDAVESGRSLYIFRYCLCLQGQRLN
jgi:hypothetical protein